ncbi:hypothetical protein PSY31_24025, partial [Shigella flexneri]|nr:hypothetical protein [Shigella flexneri]
EIFGISRGIDKQGALLLEQDGIIKPPVCLFRVKCQIFLYHQ